MCGIVGFIGKEEAGPILIEGLSRLEYRGYDSAGLAVYSKEYGMQVAKTKGRLQALCDLTQEGTTLHGAVGLGHTRWATHGEPSDINSHPHISEGGRFAVVHNGIIENYAELREFLQRKGVRFVSQTDSEVVAQLLEYYYKEDLLEAVGQTLRQLRGAYALGILCTDHPDKLIAVRQDSPLVLGHGEDFQMLASDVTAVIKYTREVTYLDNGELAVVTAQGIQVYDSYFQPVEKEKCHVDWEISAAEKGGYEHFMAKEIMEQPEAFRKTVFPRIRNGRVVLDDLHFDAAYLRDMDKIYIIACGSSYHVGIVAKYNFEKLLRKPVEVALASEFRYSDPIVTDRTLALVISQSGETIDTLTAMREAKRLGARVLAIVNAVGSSIAREADDVLYTWAGPEIAVATTKAYSTQMALTYLTALYFSDLLQTITKEEYDEIVSELLLIPTKLEQILEQRDSVQYFASLYFNQPSIFFMGRNIDYAVGLEGSLKLKEISYIHSEAYAAGELKHGTISLIEPGTLVVALGSYGPLFEKMMSNVVEVRSRGADVIGLTTQEQAEKMKKIVDHTIVVPHTHPLLLPSLDVVPLQLFAYYVALQRGCDIDKPRNLAKSVTVE